jgi:NAD(P)-dependent dehydrogenase (short-subunit alcohol dehydrogenase family)
VFKKDKIMKRILVTGANKGIGLATVTAILSQHDDTSVILGSRNLARGQDAVDALLRNHADWAPRLEVLELDVSSDSSVEQAAAKLQTNAFSEYLPLYAIVNNAGIGVGASDLLSVLQVNVFGIHRVCEAFVPLLDAGQGRVVNITSAAGPNFVSRCGSQLRQRLTDANISWENLREILLDALAGEGAGEGADDANNIAVEEFYGFSKACANSYTLYLARTWPALCINACTPGWIETDLTRYHVEAAGKSAAELGMKPPAEGARSALFLLFEELQGNGHYYGSDAVRSPLDSYRAPGDPPYAGE